MDHIDIYLNSKIEELNSYNSNERPLYNEFNINFKLAYLCSFSIINIVSKSMIDRKVIESNIEKLKESIIRDEFNVFYNNLFNEEEIQNYKSSVGRR